MSHSELWAADTSNVVCDVPDENDDLAALCAAVAQATGGRPSIEWQPKAENWKASVFVDASYTWDRRGDTPIEAVEGLAVALEQRCDVTIRDLHEQIGAVAAAQVALREALGRTDR